MGIGVAYLLLIQVPVYWFRHQFRNVPHEVTSERRVYLFRINSFALVMPTVRGVLETDSGPPLLPRLTFVRDLTPSVATLTGIAT